MFQKWPSENELRQTYHGNLAVSASRSASNPYPRHQTACRLEGQGFILSLNWLLTFRTLTSSWEMDPWGEVARPLRAFMSWIWAADVQGVLSPFFSAWSLGLTWWFAKKVGHPQSSPHPKKHSSQRKLLGFQHSSLCSWTLAMRNECCWERDHWPLSPKDLVWKIGGPGLSCIPCCLNDPLQDQNDLKPRLGEVLRTNLPQWAVFVNPERR